jgi:DNA-binding SARP family transcriptional activator
MYKHFCYNLDMDRRIYLLGGLQIRVGHDSRHLTAEKVRNLLAYLLLHPQRPVSREMLADLLFPNAAPERVRRNLSSTLSRLKAALGSGWLKIQRDSLALDVSADLWVDVWEFERLAASELTSEIQEAADLYSGDLLPELYEDWIVPERELLRNQYLAVLEKLALLYEQRGELQPALMTMRRLVLAEPLHEPAHMAYLRLLGRLQRYGEAIAHFDYLRKLLQDELGTEPMAETRQVVEGLESERALATAQVVRDEEIEFVGRVRERTAALEAVELALQGLGGILAIEGEAGIGKSRFLREVAAGARWRGATVIQGQASETPEASPFAPLAAALAPARR